MIIPEPLLLVLILVVALVVVLVLILILVLLVLVFAAWQGSLGSLSCRRARAGLFSALGARTT